MLLVALGLLSAELVACSSASPEHPVSVRECDEYQRAFATCHGRDAAAASERIPILATSETERDRLVSLCRVNLRRLRDTCH